MFMDKNNTFLSHIGLFFKKNDSSVIMFAIINVTLLRQQFVQQDVTCLKCSLSVGKALGHKGGITTVYDVVSKEVV